MKEIGAIILAFYATICLALKSSPDIRIGIIGAGPSGLVAASELLRKGYQKVVVLEKESEIGGKVKTFFYEDKPYEMGAVVATRDYNGILEIADELGLKLAPTPSSLFYSNTGDTRSRLAWSKEKYGRLRFPKLAKGFGKFSYYIWRHNDFFDPGFANTPTEMHQSFEDFMAQQGMNAVLEAYRPVMVGCGYGYAEDMPAPYWMKLMKTLAHERNKNLLRFRPFFQGFSGGWQSLWQDFAKRRNIDVRLNSRVLDIDANPYNGTRAIIARTRKELMIFDRLIISAPQITAKLMTRDDEIKAIFSKVRTIPYKVTLAEIEGLPTNAHLWLRENSYKNDAEGHSNDGKPVLISSNHDTNIYQIYQFTEMGKSRALLRDLMNETVEGINGNVIKIIKEETHEYFPHFDADAFKEGLHTKLIEMQGKKGIYYTGSLLNFETVELSARHAKYLVEKYF